MVCAASSFTFNYRAKHKNDELWTNPPTQPTIKASGKVADYDKNYAMKMLKDQPNFIHVTDSLYMGDAVALDKVLQLPFSDVLCVDANLPNPWWLAKIDRHRSKFINSVLNNFLEMDTENVSNTEKVGGVHGNVTNNAEGNEGVEGIEVGDATVNGEVIELVPKKISEPANSAKHGHLDITIKQAKLEEMSTRKRSEFAKSQQLMRLSKAEVKKQEEEQIKINEAPVVKVAEVEVEPEQLKKKESDPPERFVRFHRIPFPAQSDKPMEAIMLKEAVNWLRSKTFLNKPTLLVSTHAFRRAPNVALAYLYRQKIKPTLGKCIKMLSCKRPMFLTHDLMPTLERNFSYQSLEIDLKSKISPIPFDST